MFSAEIFCGHGFLRVTCQSCCSYWKHCVTLCSCPRLSKETEDMKPPVSTQSLKETDQTITLLFRWICLSFFAASLHYYLFKNVIPRMQWVKEKDKWKLWFMNLKANIFINCASSDSDVRRRYWCLKNSLGFKGIFCFCIREPFQGLNPFMQLKSPFYLIFLYSSK